MKKLLIALAAVSTLAVGATAAQAKAHFNVYLGGNGYYAGHGYNEYYEPVGYYSNECHWKNFKVVKWVYGERVVVWKKKKVCHKVYHKSY